MPESFWKATESVLAADAEATKHALAACGTEAPEASTVLLAVWPLVVEQIIDPYTIIGYEHELDPTSGAFVPTGQTTPVAQVLASLQPWTAGEHKQLVADCLRLACASQLLRHARQAVPLGMSDVILYSRRQRPLSEHKPFQPTHEMFERVCLDPVARERWQPAPRMWFVSRELPKSSSPYLCTGIWDRACVQADECDPDSRHRWQAFHEAIADAFVANGQYTSALIVVMCTTEINPWEFLDAQATRIDAADADRVSRFVIAATYLAECLSMKRSKRPTAEDVQGSAFAAVGSWILEHASSKEQSVFLDCGELNRSLFERRAR